MNYDTIILEMLSRIQTLEEQVRMLTEKMDGTAEGFAGESPAGPKVSTADIRAYILSLISTARKQGDRFLVLKANDIHKAMHLKSRFPMVCNAMRQCMRDGDEVVFAPASGYSSTLEIKYSLADRGEN